MGLDTLYSQLTRNPARSICEATARRGKAIRTRSLSRIDDKLSTERPAPTLIYRISRFFARPVMLLGLTEGVTAGDGPYRYTKLLPRARGCVFSKYEAVNIVAV